MKTAEFLPLFASCYLFRFKSTLKLLFVLFYVENMSLHIVLYLNTL